MKFAKVEEGWEIEGRGKSATRRIKELDWVEVSTVIRGASPQTATISAKTDNDAKPLLEVFTDDSVEDIASDTKVEVSTDASDTEMLQARIELEKTKLELYKKRKPKR